MKTMLAPTPAPQMDTRQTDPRRSYEIPPVRARFQAIAEIIAEVARESRLTVAMLVGDRRSRPIVAARHMAYWRAARETGASLAAIGRAFGDRDHTTILHGIRKHEERMSLAAASPAPAV